MSTSTFKRDLEFMRIRLGAPIEYDSRQNGYYLTDNSFELPSFWFNRPQLLLIIGVAKQLDSIAGEIPGDVRDVFANASRLAALGRPPCWGVD